MLKAILEVIFEEALRRKMSVLLEAHTYFSPNLLMIWKCFAFALSVGFSILLVWSAKFWFFDDTYREEYLKSKDPPRQEQVAAFNVKTYGFETITRIPLTTAALDEAESEASDEELEKPPEIIVQAKEEIEVEDGVIKQELALVYPDAEQTLLDYLILHGRFIWVKGSSTHFEGLTDEQIPFEDALKKDFVRSFFKDSKFAFCFGLASSEPPSPTGPSNTKLSDDRAVNLCQAMINLDYLPNAGDGQLAIALSLGERIESEELTANYSAQRQVLLASVREPRKIVKPSHIVAAIDQLLARKPLLTGGLELSKYRRDDGREYRARRIQGKRAGYTGTDGYKWKEWDSDEDMRELITDSSTTNESQTESPTPDGQ
ncbi:hypothetical protein [Hyphomonas pacifica]|uniref:hypothetical protein n=1 Tax=Hyphomonas pacifica TaxID=1280941 RepID=UPI000DC041B6|nr:hypothetical protein [Hyphomonas pacifica]RAN36267.1 hypothetical protein HY11_11915 [Hyphomonas pacifica]